MKILKLKSIVFHITIILACITFSNFTKAQLTTNDGNLYFKNNKQRFVGNGVGDLKYYSDHESASYFLV